MSGTTGDQLDYWSIRVPAVLGHNEEVIRYFQDVISSRKGRWLAELNTLRLDPIYAPIRPDPRVRQLIANGEAWLRDLRAKEVRAHEKASQPAS